MAFSKEELEQFADLLDTQFRQYDTLMVKRFQLIDQRFKEQHDTIIAEVWQIVHTEHSAMSLEMRNLIKPLQIDISEIKESLDRFMVMESEDVRALAEDITQIKTRLTNGGL